MPQRQLRLVVGLGNPGKTYSKTRHNAGFMVVDKISDAFSIALDKQKFDARFGIGSVNDEKIVLAKPMAYMNRSGPQVQKNCRVF